MHGGDRAAAHDVGERGGAAWGWGSCAGGGGGWGSAAGARIGAHSEDGSLAEREVSGHVYS